MNKLSKKKWITLITAVIFIFLGVLLAIKTCITVERKEGRNRISNFVQSSLNEDILFIGTSHMDKAVKPMELWNKYGYTSYVLTSPGNGVKRNIAMLEIALDYTKPKLVVLDVDRYWEDDDLDKQVFCYHSFSDAFPLSRTKIRVTLDMYKDNSARKELLFPGLIYHNRWNELGESDFQSQNDSQYLKGSSYETSIVKADLPKEPINTDSQIEMEPDGLIEIEKFVQKCIENDIEVLLLTLPYSANNEERLYGMKVNEIAQKYAIDYINFNESHSFLDETIDFRDASHMNISGGEKMTEYLGKYISENYDVLDRRLEPDYLNQWNEDYIAYCDWKKEKLKQETELKTFLLRCSDVDLNYMVYVKAGAECSGDDSVVRLLRNINPLEQLDNALSNQADYFAFIDCETGQAQEFVSPDYIETMSPLGKIHFYVEEVNDPILSIENREDMTLTFEEGDKDIYIWVFDKVTGELVCKRSFKRSEDYVAVES